MSRASTCSRRSNSAMDAVASSSYMVSLEKLGSSHAPASSAHLPPSLPPRSPARHLDYYPTRSPARATHLDQLHLKSPAHHHVDSRKCQLGKGGLHIGMPRVKVRFCSLLFLVAKMKRSCGRAVMLAATPGAASGAVGKSQRGIAANTKLARGISGSYSCGGSYPDAVVDCIDYIKKSGMTEPSPTEC